MKSVLGRRNLKFWEEKFHKSSENFCDKQDLGCQVSRKIA
jgi:hypothetical protein